MSMIMPYIWISVMVFAAVAEIYALNFISAWFIPSAFIIFFLSLTGLKVWIQVLLFFIITLIPLVLSRIIFKKFIKSKSINYITGKNAIVTEEINNYKNTGLIRITGLVLTARAEEEDIIYESGLVVMIVGRTGGKIICTR